MEALISLSQLYPPFFYGLVFLVSLMVGSFLNVVIHRLPIMMENSWKQEYSAVPYKHLTLPKNRAREITLV